eukprot:TRINITY_DN38329_c0_g1_i1.p1 TRINITY_DN38329_c0_g1~~TRINITY_DN38329_c0_g1_i1.p1  ORF type:complete len:606 (+),score=105.33 TRINITY_DN38329_c0_g1_i1:220-2037(+)
MASADDLQRMIEEARRVGEQLDQDNNILETEVDEAIERQRLRRVLGSIQESNQQKRSRHWQLQQQREEVDKDCDGPHLFTSDVSEQRQKGPQYYVRKAGDAWNCNYNVFKKEHIWKIEGMAWLKSALQQSYASYAESKALWLGPMENHPDNSCFTIRYNPFPVESRVVMNEVRGYRTFDQDENQQVGSLVIYHAYGPDVVLRHSFYIQQAGGGFVQWGDTGSEFADPHGQVYGPDVQRMHETLWGDAPLQPIGIFGLTLEELLQSEWVQDDTLTIKVVIEVRTELACGPYDCINYNFDVSPPQIISNLKGLLQGGKHRDVTFIVEGKRIKAHSLILSMQSEVFDRLLHAGMRESKEREVFIPQCDPVAFEAMLEYLYTDEFDSLEKTLKDASSDEQLPLLQKILEVSHKYQITRLQVWCEQQLADRITVDSACDILYQAHVMDAKQLEQACIDFVREESFSVMASSNFARLSVECPEAVLKISMPSAGVTGDRAAAALNECVTARREMASTCTRAGEPGQSTDNAPDLVDDVDRSSFANRRGWSECHVLEDWSSDDPDDEYLKLQNGDLLLVRPGYVEGWAFGHSPARGTSGWFPPTFVMENGRP